MWPEGKALLIKFYWNFTRLLLFPIKYVPKRENIYGHPSNHQTTSYGPAKYLYPTANLISSHGKIVRLTSIESKRNPLGSSVRMLGQRLIKGSRSHRDSRFVISQRIFLNVCAKSVELNCRGRFGDECSTRNERWRTELKRRIEVGVC